MNYTPAQQAAIECRDRSVFLSAAAGSGKTAVLTARVIAALTDTDKPTSLSRLLAVTFTESAALEMRARIGRALAERLRAGDDDTKLSRELRLLPVADISTIDAFCHKLLRRYGTHVVPEGFRVTDTAEAEGIRADLMEKTVEQGYAGGIPGLTAEAFSALSDAVTGFNGERRLGEELLKLYEKLSTYEKGVASLFTYADRYRREAEMPVFETEFGRLLAERIRTTAGPAAAELLEKYECEVLPREAEIGPYIPDVARGMIPCLREVIAPTDYEKTREACLFRAPGKFVKKGHSAACADFIADTDINTVLKRYTIVLAAALGGAPKPEAPPPLLTYRVEDWQGLYRDLAEVTEGLARTLTAFDRRYFEESRRRRAFDFNQLTRAAHDLLVSEDGQPTEIARQIAGNYDMVAVDEYQDVSPLQNAVFEAISKPDNRFFVGDIKQSIYRFRHAEPDIFAALRNDYPRLPYDGESGQPHPGDAPAYAHFMGNNFRCDREVVRFVNSVFSFLFGAAGESIGYDREADNLLFCKSTEGTTVFPQPEVVCFESVYTQRMTAAAAAAAREGDATDAPGTARDGDAPDARRTSVDGLPPARDVLAAGEGTDGEGDTDTDDEEANPAEALWVAREIRRLLDGGTHTDGVTPLRPSDIAILSRRVQGKLTSFVRALARFGVPVTLPDEENFFESPEILLAVSLLTVIDNPLSDIPLAAVLCSPLCRMTPDTLAAIRREGAEGIPLFEALTAFCAAHPDFSAGHEFLSLLASFRHEAEDTSVAHLVRRIFAETPLYSLAGADGRPAERNLKLLYHHARTFAGASYEGLHGFLAYIRRQSESNKKFKSPGGASEADAVRVMSIHSSKGLEFPVVFLVNAGDAFSSRDEKDTFFTDHALGVTLRLRDATGQIGLDNPVHTLMKMTLRDKSREEEMRLLYVALTRARERLIVTGSARGRSKLGGGEAGKRIDLIRDAFRDRPRLLACSSYLEWLMAGNACDAAGIPCRANGEEIVPPPLPFTPDAAVADAEETKRLEEQLRAGFARTLAVTSLPRLPKKLAVSSLTPRLLDGSEAEETPLVLPEEDDLSGEDGGDAGDPHEKYRRLPLAYTGERAPDPTERGIATHQFLQFCDFARLAREGVDAEMQRLIDGAFLSREQAALTRPGELEAFRRSDLFAEMCAAREVRREFRFHMFLPAEDFTQDPEAKGRLAGETLFIQGVMDAIYVTADGSLTLVDYKTDRLTRAELRDPALARAKLLRRHSEQMRYYAEAAKRIFGQAPKRVLLYSLHAGRSFDATPAV